MAINQEYPIIDGIAPSWSDIIIRLTPKGAPLIKATQIKSIKRSRKVSVGSQRGATGGNVIKTTTGEAEYELSIVFYQDGWNEMLEKITPLAPSRGNQRAISLVHIGVQVQYTPIGQTRIYEWRAKGARIVGDSFDAAEGVEANTIEVPYNVKQIVDMVNGLEAVML